MALFATHVVTPDSALGGKVIERSLRFDPDSSAYLNRTPSSAGNRKTMTLSVWVKGMVGGTYAIFDAHQNDSNRSRVFFNDNGSISFFNRISNSDTNCHTSGFFRDPSAWYHIVFVFDTTEASASNRYKIYINGVEQANDANIPAQNTDLFFNSTNSHKIGVGGDDQGNENYFDGYMTEINFLDGTAFDASYFGFTSQNGTWLPKRFDKSNIPNRKGRTFSGTWTASGNGFGSAPVTRAYAGDLSSYANNSAGGQILTWNTSTYNLSGNLRIYCYSNSGVYDIYVNGNATKVADTPSEVGNVAWVDCGTFDQINEIQFAGTSYNTNNGLGSTGVYFSGFMVNGTLLRDDMSEYGTNGFYLDFLDNTSATTLGYDKSYNANHFTPNNLSVSAGKANDSFLDTPTNNFPTLNPVSLYHVHSTSSNVAEGNLRYNCTSDNQGQVPATMSMPTSGKWYFEAEVISNANFAMGIVPVTWTVNRNSFSNEPGTLGYAAYGSKFENGSEGAGWGDGWDSGNYAAAAVDMDLKQVTFYKNNTSQGTLSFKSGYEDLEYFPIITGGTNSGTVSGYVNFGAQGFQYTPPTGFKALNSRNRAGATGTAAVVNPRRFFDTLVYTGDTSGNLKVTGLQFKPDFVWIKRRSGGTDNNQLFDTVRDFTNGRRLFSNTDGTEAQNGSQYGMISVNDDGFTVGAGPFEANRDGDGHVAWCWKAGGDSNTYNIDGTGYGTASAAGLDGGSINPTGASVNTESGFGIYTYTGNGSNATIAHGLGKAPEWIIIKNRNATTGSTENWTIYHVENTDNPETDYLSLNGTSSTSDLNTIWNDTAPTSTLISIGSHARVNESASVNYIMYAWTGIDGFSKFGSYVGDGRNDRFSTYIYTGFRPNWVLVKGSDFAGNWNLFDTRRPGYNVTNDRLFPNLSDAETDGSDANNQIDIFSNGFKMKGTNVDTNSSGSTYIYMAFAEQPNGTIFGIDADAR